MGSCFTCLQTKVASITVLRLEDKQYFQEKYREKS